MVWTSLAALGVPYLVYDSLEKAAYKDFYGTKKPAADTYFEIPETREYFTTKVRAWEQIRFVNMVTFGPLFLLGMFGLSEFLGWFVAFYILQIYSNLFFPALVWDFYQMFGVYV